MQFIEYLVEKIREAGQKYNPDVQIAPACILWPDGAHQWKGVIETLLSEIPELFILGDYNPENRTGPAIWLRCVISKKIDDFTLLDDTKPILYLPGVSRQDLRDVENCPDHLKPLAELQYRGVIWSQINAKDWTILAFLKSHTGGLGLDIAQDTESKSAMLRALDPLLHNEIESLRAKRLDSNFFNALLASDYTRKLLQWLNQGEVFRSSQNENEWQAFMEICKSNLKYNPEKEGILTGAEKLASHDKLWEPVWDRFCEAPRRYPNIPDRIRSCNPPRSMAWWIPSKSDYVKWPQWNDDQEKNLHKQLETLVSLPPHEARDKIIELEKDHRARRDIIWAELGEAPLAQAMEHLAIISQTTKRALAAGTFEDLVTVYQDVGWQADNAVMQVLTCIKKQEDIKVIELALQVIYKPWAEESARYIQKIVDEHGYPGGDVSTHQTPNYQKGECLLFVDGLRFDAAKRLVMKLEEKRYHIDLKQTWAPIPTVTATGKPAVTPIHDKLFGIHINNEFEPSITESGKSLKSSYQLKKLLQDAGWKILDDSSNGNMNNNAWFEFGDIDHEGHERGWKLALHLDDILCDIRDQVIQLLEVGWKRVRIITDHGWLLLPGNLPKTELPSAQTETKWGRCAIVKPGASTKERLYPWYWNPNQHFALADGISCFRYGLEYAHGGVSLQECLILEILVSPGSLHTSRIAPEIIDVVWKGLRCTVTVDGVFENLSLDIRTQPGDSASSVVLAVNQIRKNRVASVVVENEDLEGVEATIVIIDQKNELVTQINTIIGGGMR